MDSDLAESISALKESFEKSGQSPFLGKASQDFVASLKDKLGLPRRYCEFLAECDPADLEIATPTERVCLFGANQLLEEQTGFAFGDGQELIKVPSTAGWKPHWVIIAVSGLLGDPYFLDVSRADAEGDCPVFTAMSGTETWQPRLCASSFAMFVRILAVNQEVAQDFDIDDYDDDNERVFREAVGPRIRQYDPAAVKAGHWT